MNGAERVASWFESGALVHPGSGEAGFADLVQAFRITGQPDGLRAAPGHAAALAGLLGTARSRIFVLVDGLGAELVETLPAGSFLRTNMVTTLRAVFPATTASALTTLATGLWPADHCIPGWWTRLPQADLSAVSLLFTERQSGKPLSQFGVEPGTLYPVPSIWPSFGFVAHSVLPSEIANSVFAGYLSGGTPRSPYTSLEQALAVAEGIVVRAHEPIFVYVYLPHLDTLLHGVGSDDARVRDLLLEIDGRLDRLAKAVCGRAQLVVSADHGLVDVPRERVFVLRADDPLSLHLSCPPTGEPSVPVFHLRQGHEEPFAEQFAQRFGDLFALVTAGEAESLHLYGPGKLAPVMRDRLGSFIGIAPRPAKLYLEPVGSSTRHRAIHGGLRSAEMLTPLIVA